MGLKICITGKYGPAVSIDLYSETGKAAKKIQRNATVFLGKLPGTTGTFTKNKDTGCAKLGG